MMDRRCVLVTPYHRLMCRLQELVRDKSRLGSTGHGVGAAALEAATWTTIPGHPGMVQLADALDPSTGKMRQRLEYVGAVQPRSFFFPPLLP